jgi:hypothetical protein
MQLRIKIKWKHYLLGLVSTFLIFCWFLNGLNEYLGYFVGLLGVVLNHLFLMLGGRNLIIARTVDDGNKGAAVKGFVYLILKFVILAWALVMSVQLMPNKIFIPVIVYIYMLFILVISLQRVD